MTVRLSREGAFAVITLDRPEALNALNSEMIALIGTAIDDAAEQTPAALIFVGAGEKAFCAGADIKELLGRTAEEQREASRRGQSTFAKLDGLPFPSLAVIRGVALGGGLELAMACTFRVAAPGARMGLPEIKLGLIPGYGGTQRLPRLVGTARALEIIGSGRMVPADEAHRIGLVNEVSDVADPMEAGIQFLSRFGEHFPAAIHHTRKAVEGALDMSLADGFEAEARLFADASQTRDAIEGMQAFLEKRKPSFTGL